MIIEAVIPPPVAPAPAADNAAETARIQKELELEAKRQKWRGATTNTPMVGGIIGWLIKKKIVEGELQANISLLGVAVIASVLAGVIFVWSNSNQSKPTPTPQELKAMLQPPVSPANAALHP